MSLYLSPRRGSGTVAVAICERCGFKKHYVDLHKDPNNGLMVCDKCVDDYDPYRLPARRTENTALPGGAFPDEVLE